MDKLRQTGAVSQPRKRALHVKSEQTFSARHGSPPHDNMGVNNAKDKGAGGFTIFDVTPLGKPEDYFYRIGLDTLQVSVKGRWLPENGAADLLEQRRAAELHQELGFGDTPFLAHDGRKLKVFPHGGRPSYQVLMRDGDGLEVRALPNGNMPSFIFRFGARWCVQNTITELGTWMRNLVETIGFKPFKLHLSEVHIRCDAPTPFVVADLKRMRGVGTRNGRFNTHHYRGKLSGIDNLGGSKQIKFVIYDKRLEQAQKETVLWPAVWKSYGIEADMPIWRVEARWDRKALKALGLDALADLNKTTIRGLWHRFTHRYLLFVSDSDKRTSRTTPTRKWAKFQACGEMMEARPVSAKVQVTATQLIKQATGCIAKAMAVAGIGHSEAEMHDLIEQAMLVGQERFKEQRQHYIRLFLQNILERYPDDAFAGSQAVQGEIQSLIDQALSRKPIAMPFDGTQPIGGEG